MATSERINKDIDAIIKMLKLSEKAVPKILARRKIKELERTLKSIEEQRDEAHRLKTNAQMLMFKEEMSEGEVNAFGEQIDERLLKSEEQCDQLQITIEEIKQEKRNAKYEEELKLEQMKLEMRMKFDRKTIEANKGQEVKVKLPKLVISKFEATHLDWQRFWGQFESEIDKSTLSAVAKFSYLKELVGSKAKVCIEGLPFTSEGYERAKSILKTKYGKPSEVANAHIQAIMSLPIIHQCNVQKVHEFYEKLTTNVQSLETMGKLKEINGYVRLTLDKLPSIRADLVILDDDWQEWNFGQLLESLRKWTERNPIAVHEQRKQEPKRESLSHTKQGEYKPRKCIYCDEENHKAASCKKINKLEERRKIVSDKKLCFNCTGSGHRAVNCPSRIRCQHCKNKHHTSLCDKVTRTPSLATTQDPVIYPTVMVQVNGVKCLALLDTGAGSSYASNTLINRLSLKPKKTEVKRIEMMLHTSKKKSEIFSVTISSLDETFTINTEVSKIEKSALLSIPNPRFSDLKKNYRHLKNVYIEDYHAKEEVPVHLILGASDYARIKTRTAPRIGSSGEPVAELTKLGWTIISPGKEVDLMNLYLTQSSSEDYERLCALDVLGLEEASCGNHDEVYQKFKNQLIKAPEGWYETGLLWKTDGLPETNKQGSLGRLENLLSKLKKKPGLLKEYNEIMVKQLGEGIIEKVTCEAVSGKEFYLPHRPVVREQAETTKVRIVCDASARPNDSSPSLNDSLETGPPLQNLLWNIIMRNRFKSVSLCGDIKQAFLQIRIKKEDRDCLRFHWAFDQMRRNVETLRFTRAIFGMGQSPFLLNGTIDVHFDEMKKLHNDLKEIIEEIEDDLYVDDLISGGVNVKETAKLKEIAKSTFAEAGFVLHKWHSNKRELEDDEAIASSAEQSYAKQTLGVKENESKILGSAWNKKDDTLAVNIQELNVEETKRGILKFLASIFDPLGFASPVLLVGKLIYREVCEQKFNWDQPLSQELSRRWKRWIDSLPAKVELPRTLAKFEQPINKIDLHVFGDASFDGV